MNDRRLGKFYLSPHMIEAQPEAAQAVMARCIAIVRAEMLYDRDEIEYIAISEDFAPVSEVACVPTYRVVVRDRGYDGDPLRVGFLPGDGGGFT